MDGVVTEMIDVLIVGAGLSGIGLACHLRRDSPGTTFALLESRRTSGGTWDLFRYPGVRSDSDMFTLGYDFRPWTDAEAIADGATVLGYLRDTAREFDIDRHIRFGHQVISAAWSSDDARWTVTASTGDAEIILHCRFLALCSGYYSYDHGYTPEFSGADSFSGELVHPQHWPADLACDGRRIVVIGSGATAVTLVPALSDRGARVTMLQRSPSYVLPLAARDPLAEIALRVLRRPTAAALVRWKNLLVTTSFYRLTRWRPGLARRYLRRAVTPHLPAGFDRRHLTPDYDPWDQRLCIVPDGDLFRVLRDGSAEIVTDTIDRFDRTGVLLTSGRHIEADIIVTATGLRIRVAGDIAISVDGDPVRPADRLAYKGTLLAGVPNLALVIGYAHASWTLKADLVSHYLIRLLRFMSENGYTTVTPRTPEVGPLESLDPLIDLSSGYIRRSLDAMPRQGPRWPWRMSPSYLGDRYRFRHGPVDDDVDFGSGGSTSARNADGMATVRVNGLVIRFRSTGSSDPAHGTVLLLHGLGRSLDDWAEQHDRLSRDHRVISVDLPGFGGSDRGPEPITLAGSGDFVADFLDAVDVVAPVHVVGNSLGGAVAMAFVAAHPQRTASLLLAGSPGFGAEASLGLRVMTVPVLNRLLLRPNRFAAGIILRSVVNDPTLITGTRIRNTQQLFRGRHQARTMIEFARALGTFRGVRPGWRSSLIDGVRASGVPTLILWGQQDRIIPATDLETARTLLPDAETLLLSPAGHLVQIEQPDDFAAAASDFVERHPAHTMTSGARA